MQSPLDPRNKQQHHQRRPEPPRVSCWEQMKGGFMMGGITGTMFGVVLGAGFTAYQGGTFKQFVRNAGVSGLRSGVFFAGLMTLGSVFRGCISTQD